MVALLYLSVTVSDLYEFSVDNQSAKSSDDASVSKQDFKCQALTSL